MRQSASHSSNPEEGGWLGYEDSGKAVISQEVAFVPEPDVPGWYLAEVFRFGGAEDGGRLGWTAVQFRSDGTAVDQELFRTRQEAEVVLAREEGL